MFYVSKSNWDFKNKLAIFRRSWKHMQLPNFFNSYKKQISKLLQNNNEAEAMSLSVGGDFETVGLLEYYLLLQHGLQKKHTVIDVGCGSGRLTLQLREYLEGAYIGIDIAPQLFKYAQKIAQRPDWKFYQAPGLTIPEKDNSGDFVCFFSVFTHLLHEETYRYLAEARRVVKSGGKIIFSFLEFAIPSHWLMFQNILNDSSPDKILNQFISRGAIKAWAEHLNLIILEIIDGDKPHIPIQKTVRWKDGCEMIGKGNLGQSICIMTKE